PILLCKDLVIELRADTQDQSDAAVPIHTVESLVRTQVVVDQPGLTSINREDIGAPPRVQRLRGPGWLGLHLSCERWRTDIGRLCAPDHCIASESRPYLPAYLGRGTIAADQILTDNQQRLAGFQVLRFRCHS